MTNEQRTHLMNLIYQFGAASEALGAVDGSFGWNTVYSRQEALLCEIQAYVNSLVTS